MHKNETTRPPHHFSSQIILKNSQIICVSLWTAVLCRYDSNFYFYKLKPSYQPL